MGLDVYLYRYEDFERARALEEEYQERSDDVWSKHKQGDSPDGPRAACAAIAAELGLDKYGGAEHLKQEIYLPSEIHPGHMFRIGYMRSSYNEGGIDHVLSNAIGRSLGWIFEAEDYLVRPDWKKALRRARQARSEWQAHLQKAPYMVTVARSNWFVSPDELPADEHAALQVFIKEAERWKDKRVGMDSYLNRDGEFFANEPLKVRGIIQGRDPYDPGKSVIYLIYEYAGGSWYTEALDIVIETIEYVLAQEDPEKYVLHWSG